MSPPTLGERTGNGFNVRLFATDLGYSFVDLPKPTGLPASDSGTFARGSAQTDGSYNLNASFLRMSSDYSA